MKPYVLRLVKKDFSEEIIPYLSINRNKRIWLKAELETNNAHLYCNCLYPTSKIELHVKKDYSIAPIKQHCKHNDSCPKSELAKQMAIYNSAFKYKDEYQKDIIVNVSLDFSKKKRREVCGGTYQSYKAPITNHKMTVTALIKKLNMITFQDAAFSTNATQYLCFEDFCRWVNWKTKHIYISEYKTLRNLSIKQDGKQFFYGEFNEYKCTSKIYVQLVTTIYTSSKNKEKNEYENLSVIYKMSFNKDGIELAFKEFENTYNGMTIESAKSQGYRIVCSGFYTKENGYYKCLDVHFILVNQYGLFSESKYEADMYDYICEYLNTNNLKERYIFYKPWEFGYSIYENHYLEDGIIYDKFADESYYVEIFGMNTPDYLKTKAHKELLAKDRLIKWDAYNNIEKPNLNSYLINCENE